MDLFRKIKIKNLIKRYVAFIFIFSLQVSAAETNKVFIPDAPDIKSKSYVLMDAETGTVLKDVNGEQKLEPASLTKLMTAYVVFDEIKSGRLKLDDKVKISAKAWKIKGSKTFVEVDDMVSVETLIKGMIVQSGNDASTALAEHIAGNVDNFSDIMNAYAKNLNMKNSHFKNPTGLPSPDHYTTAMDLSILTKNLIDNFPEYYYIYQLKSFTYNNITQSNRNRLLKEDLGFDGLKTGFTNSAGYCYVGSSKRGDSRMIITIMGSSSPAQRFADAKAMVNYGFRFFETHKVLKKNLPIEELTTDVIDGKKDTILVGTKNDVVLTLQKGELEQLKFDVKLINKATAPIVSGEKIGEIKIILNGKEMGSSELITLSGSEKAGFFEGLLKKFF